MPSPPGLLFCFTTSQYLYTLKVALARYLIFRTTRRASIKFQSEKNIICLLFIFSQRGFFSDFVCDSLVIFRRCLEKVTSKMYTA